MLFRSERRVRTVLYSTVTPILAIHNGFRNVGWRRRVNTPRNFYGAVNIGGPSFPSTLRRLIWEWKVLGGVTLLRLLLWGRGCWRGYTGVRWESNCSGVGGMSIQRSGVSIANIPISHGTSQYSSIPYSNLQTQYDAIPPILI